MDVEKEKTIYRIGIEKSVARQVLDMSKAYGVHAHTYNDRFILTESYDECVEFYRRVIKTPVIVADDITPYMDVLPCKIIAIELHDHEKQERLKKDVEKLYEGTLSMFYSNPYYLEFVPASSGKGSALTRLSEILGIDKNDTYAAGDAENDLSMIQAAGCGIAMVNGEDTVKAAADIVTEKDNDHDGLADILMNIISKSFFVLLRRVLWDYLIRHCMRLRHQTDPEKEHFLQSGRQTELLHLPVNLKILKNLRRQWM